MIFYVEDDTSSRELTLYTLRSAGYDAEGFSDAAQFWEGMKSCVPELILLDIMLPDEDGVSILRKLRADIVTAEIPVIMATAKGTEYDKVIGLDLGADDYLAKPFGMMELLSRIKALLRRCKLLGSKEEISVGGVRMNGRSHTVTVDGLEVELTLKEYDLLRLFMTNAGKIFTREMLLGAVWDHGYEGETRTVDVHVGTLRNKLGTRAGLIKTVRGVGYRMENRK